MYRSFTELLKLFSLTFSVIPNHSQEKKNKNDCVNIHSILEYYITFNWDFKWNYMLRHDAGIFIIKFVHSSYCIYFLHETKLL